MSMQEIRTVACLGTGTMGPGLAFLAARAGYAVFLFGRTEESLHRGLAGVDQAIAIYENNELMPKGEGEAVKKRIRAVTSLERAAEAADLVMESVAEDVEVKRRTYAVVERCCRPETIIATNTSGLDLGLVSSGLKRPQRFLALHFFSPPYLMTPVEVAPIPATLPEVRALGVRWVESLGNVPIILEKAIQGFIVNRIQAACLREALHIVEQGWASAETVDTAVALSLGRRYTVTGPIESADMGGLDIFNSVLSELCPTLCSRTESGPLVDEAVKSGQLGLKSGGGIYAWTPEIIAARRKARERALISFLKQGCGPALRSAGED